ncbi:MAG: ferredoxin [Candidatus Omnitrophica bacterium]|nr:ferredoxin [Candidatus Omnitrophota bacterium]
MARVSVDASLCTGCGLCVSSCPEVFEMGDDNVAQVIAQSSDSCDLQEIASQCPVEAISVN